jgi:murein tripeptide amidase MpaA
VNYRTANLFRVFVSFNTLQRENVATAAYNFPWYKCDKDVRIMIQQIMLRAQKEYVISAPFVVVSMETFTKVSDDDTIFLKLDIQLSTYFFQIVNSTASLIALMKSFL